MAPALSEFPCHLVIVVTFWGAASKATRLGLEEGKNGCNEGIVLLLNYRSIIEAVRHRLRPVRHAGIDGRQSMQIIEA